MSVWKRSEIQEVLWALACRSKLFLRGNNLDSHPGLANNSMIVYTPVVVDRRQDLDLFPSYS